MVSKKSFTLLVDTGTIQIFAVVPIISDGDFGRQKTACFFVCFFNIKKFTRYTHNIKNKKY